MPKVKLLESRSMTIGMVKAGAVIDLPAASAEHLVVHHQADYHNDPEKTAEVRDAHQSQTLAQLLQQSAATAAAASQPAESNEPTETPDALTALDLKPSVIADLEAKDTSGNDVPAFTGIKQLREFLTGGGDLSAKSKIGKKGAETSRPPWLSLLSSTRIRSPLRLRTMISNLTTRPRPTLFWRTVMI